MQSVWKQFQGLEVGHGLLMLAHAVTGNGKNMLENTWFMFSLCNLQKNMASTCGKTDFFLLNTFTAWNCSKVMA